MAGRGCPGLLCHAPSPPFSRLSLVDKPLYLFGEIPCDGILDRKWHSLLGASCPFIQYREWCCAQFIASSARLRLLPFEAWDSIMAHVNGSEGCTFCCHPRFSSEAQCARTVGLFEELRALKFPGDLSNASLQGRVRTDLTVDPYVTIKEAWLKMLAEFLERSWHVLLGMPWKIIAWPFKVPTVYNYATGQCCYDGCS